MAESMGNRGDRNAGREHLRGHEVAKVVEAEVRKARGPACGDEVFVLRCGSQASPRRGAS